MKNDGRLLRASAFEEMLVRLLLAVNRVIDYASQNDPEQKLRLKSGRRNVA
jgi:hypothetical protein